jgi:phosphatidylglycerophosphatase A
MARATQGPASSWLNRLGWLVGTGLGSGLFPIAPATAGSLAAVVIYYFLPIAGDSIPFFLLIGIGFIIGIWATGTLISVDNHDPGKAVWDEFIGMWVTCILLPKEVWWLAAAFVTFRVLDILKPWPVRRLERLPGGLGIMADDLLAGAYGAVLLNAIYLVFFA